MRLRPALVVLIAIGAVLAGCALGGSDPLPVSGIHAAEAPNLAAMADKIETVFKMVKLTGYPRVSPVRPAAVTARTDWMVCLRSDAENDPRTYALFLQGTEVADYRLALAIDQCGGETYGSLPTPMPIK